MRTRRCREPRPTCEPGRRRGAAWRLGRVWGVWGVGGAACVAAALALLASGGARAFEAASPSRLVLETLLLDVARAGSRLVAVGERGHVILSDDEGRTWRQAREVPTRLTLTEVSFPDATNGWAVGHDAVILHSADAGETWARQFEAAEDEATLLSVWFADSLHGFAVGAFGLVLETRDGGERWERRVIPEAIEEEPHLNHLFPGPEGSLFIAAEFGWVFRSLDAGVSWERIEPTGYPGSMWGGLALGGEAVLVFGMRGHAFRSADRGETWSEVETGTDQSLQDAIRLPDDGVVMVGLGGVVATSQDGGRSFTSTTQSDRRGNAAVALGPDDSLLLLGERGVSRRTISGDELPAPILTGEGLPAR